MKTQAALIASDPVYLTWLKEALDQDIDIHWLRPHGAEESVFGQLQRLDDIEVVFLEMAEDEDRIGLLEECVESRPDLLAIAVGADSPGEAALDVMRAGARDYFVMGRDDAKLDERLRKLLRKAVSSQAGSEARGRIYSLHCASGGPVLAWTAQHLALALQEQCRRAGERILLIDASIPHGASLIFLNAAQSYSLLDAVQDVYRCDETLIDTAFTRHASGLTVLALPEDMIEPARFDEEELLSLLDVLVKHFSGIVIGTAGNLRIETTAGIVDRAQASCMVSDASILSSRTNKHLLKALRLEDCSLGRCGLVVDNDGNATRGLDAPNLAQLLELPLWADMPVNAAHRQRAMNVGEPLFATVPKDPYNRSIRDFAHRLMQRDIKALAAGEKRGGLLGRLLGDR